MRLKIDRAGRPGDGYAYIVENYRDQAGKPTCRIVEKLGRVLELEAADPGWRAKGEARAAELTAQKDSFRGVVAYDLCAPAGRVGALNVGWLLADAAFDRLGLGPWLRRRRRDKGWGQDVAEVLRLLVVSRVVWPGSKRAAVVNASRLWDGPRVSLDTVYKALDHLCEEAARIQTRARAAVAGDGERLECVYYDVTNYFFEIDQPDAPGQGHDPARGQAARRWGFSKEHRPSPIIQMGLFMDAAGMPVSYRLFDGSTPDSSTLTGAIREFKTQFGHPKVTIVADGAMNNGPNLGMLAGAGDGWVVAASIRKTTGKLRDWVLDPAGWSYEMGADGQVESMTKSKVHTRTVRYTGPDGKRTSRNITEKVIAHWSGAYAAREAQTRAEMASKAAALAGDLAKLKASNRRGVKKYIKQEQADPTTGEVSDQVVVASLDQTKLAADAQLDGYWLCHTSLLDTPDQQVLARYRQLWRIEETFRISKTDLEARPVYVWTPSHIEAHFLVCFLALVVTRLLQRHAGGLPAGQIKELLDQLVLAEAGQGLYVVGRPAGWDAIDEATSVDTNRRWATDATARTWKRGWSASFANLPPTSHAA
ncbi:MAG: IS1634 family transposase [Bifidobacteriaceae bacterium]|nr:IS1634 family transposase [Bifidobacteriaceae bacterium]